MLGIQIVFVVLAYDREGAAFVYSVHTTPDAAEHMAEVARQEYPTVKIAPSVLTD